jgi:hypothetical protein
LEDYRILHRLEIDAVFSCCAATLPGFDLRGKWYSLTSRKVQAHKLSA